MTNRHFFAGHLLPGFAALLCVDIAARLRALSAHTSAREPRCPSTHRSTARS